MSWVTALIIIFVASMAFGPLMWFRSTPTERRMIAVRNHAAGLGLRVHLTTAAELKLPGLDASDTVAAYCLLPEPLEEGQTRPWLEAPSWRLIRERISHEAHFEGYWNWQGKRQAEPERQALLRDVLAQLPPDVLALEYDRGTFCIYWQERGGPGAVEKLAAILQRMMQQAAPQND